MARPRKSKAILEARGSQHAARQKPAEIDFRKPRCPADLKPEERKVWDEVIGLLEHYNILERAHQYALERYSRMTVEWRNTTDPEIANKLATQLLRIEQHFGLTPLSRNSVSVREQKEEPNKLRHLRVS